MEGNMKIAVLDIGGTSIKSGLWQGEAIEDVRERDTNAMEGAAAVMERAKEILHSYGSFDAIGISTAGQVNFREGKISYANSNMPGYTGMRVRELMEKEFGVPVAVENDVNAAAIGEGSFGAGRGEKDFLCITYGTGVGGAIVIDGELYRGSSFSAGEFGGILLHPEARTDEDPFSGCYERYASTSALVERAKRLDASLTDGRKIFEQIQRAEVAALVEDWTEEIAHGLVSLICVFNPSCIILGGGVMAQERILELTRDKVRRRIMPSFRHVELRQAKLGNRAGLLGAAVLGARA